MMNRRQMTMLGLLGTSVSLFPALRTSTARAGDNLLETVKARGELVVGTELQFAPFEFLQDSQPTGYSVELMNLVAADLGVKVRFIDLPFVSVLPGLEVKKFDMVEATTTITKARLSHYNFTIPIADATVALVKRAGDTSIQKPSDIAGKVVGGTKGSAQTAELIAYGKTLPGGLADVKEYIGSPNAFADLQAGRLAAVAGSLPNLAYLVKRRPQDFALVLPPFGPQSYFGWLARKDDDSKPLIDAINASLLKLEQSGQVADLQKKWFGVTMNLPSTIPTPNE